MSKEKELLEIIRKTLHFPPKVIAGYARLDQSFTSGDLSRICDISSSTAKFYLNKMVDLRMVIKIPHKRKYQKFSNADSMSSWLRDLIKLGIVPLESGALRPEDD